MVDQPADAVAQFRERIEILGALHEALERWPEVAELSFTSETIEDMLVALQERFGINEVQADAVSSLQVRRTARTERERIGADLALLKAELARITGEQPSS